jgi:hypothetical protein
MFENRLGDIIDDYCIKCRRLTNHAIVSLVDGAAAKVRCRTCYHDHDYRHEQAPPSKKDLKKAELFNEVLATVAPVDGASRDGAGMDAVSMDSAGHEAGALEEPVPETVPDSSEDKKKSKAKR